MGTVSSTISILLLDRGFVVKIMHRKKRATSTEEVKTFLNIVHSEKVAKPSVSNPDPGGSTWSIPYALGPLRMERDKSGNNLIATFDCCFHPLSLRYAHARKEFLDLAINITTDAVENSFAMSGDEVKFVKGYTILRGVSYKCGTPKALMVNLSGEKMNKPHALSGEDPRVVPVVATVAGNSSIVETTDATGILVPKYKVVEQGVFDIADHTKSSPAQSIVPRRPKRIIVHVYLDKSTTTAANINLDVSERELKIQPDARCRYDLAVKLPYPVNYQKGNARFDRKQSTLMVELPVVAC